MKKDSLKKNLKKVLGIVLSVSMSVSGSILQIMAAEPVLDDVKTVGKALGNPVKNTDGSVKWDHIEFGKYWQSDTNRDGWTDRRDLKEPISWRVLSVKGNKALLLSEKALDCRKYNEEAGKITWEKSTIRSWLNGYDASENTCHKDYGSDSFFVNAFQSYEREAIMTVSLDNKDNPHYGTPGGDNTDDKVFLLSFEDVVNGEYGFKTYQDSDEEDVNADDGRIVYLTDFAVENGAFVINDPEDETASDKGWWLLRTPGLDVSYMSIVHEDGNPDLNGGKAYVDKAGGTVRPAIWVDLSLINAAPTASPVKKPTKEPTMAPATEPTKEPTMAPATEPTKEPTMAPATEPAKEPTMAPATEPTKEPTMAPATEPAKEPTMAPATEPAKEPTMAPATEPTKEPTMAPATEQAENPTVVPSRIPAEITVSPVPTVDERYPVKPYKDDNGNTVWSCIFLGRYFQTDNNGDGVANKYDMKSPIKWRVLDIQGDEALVISDRNLEKQQFNTENNAVDWTNSTIRSYLNGYTADKNVEGKDYSASKKSFYDVAFLPEEADSIVLKRLPVTVNSLYDNRTVDITNDKIFMLGYEEVTNSEYGFDSYIGNSTETGQSRTRGAKNSDYVNEQFAKSYKEILAPDNFASGNGFWWLRTPGKNGYTAMRVGITGEVIRYGSDVNVMTGCVRPAMWIKLDAETWKKAGIVVSDGTENEEAGYSSRKPGAVSTPVPTVNAGETTDIPAATRIPDLVPTTVLEEVIPTAAVTATPTPVPETGFDVQLDAWKFTNSSYNFCLPYDSNREFFYEITKADFQSLLNRAGSAAYKSFIKVHKASAWGGSSFGMSAAAVLAKAGKLDIRNISPDGKGIGDADILVNTKGDKDAGSVESLINYYQLLCRCSNIYNLEKYNIFDESANCAKIIEKMKASDDPVMLVFSLIDKKYTHAVVAYDYKQYGNVHTFKIYDNAMGRRYVFPVTITNNNGVYSSSCEQLERGWESDIVMCYALTADDISSGKLLNVLSEGNAGNENGYITLMTDYPDFRIYDGNNYVEAVSGNIAAHNALSVIPYGGVAEPEAADHTYGFLLPAADGKCYEIVYNAQGAGEGKVFKTGICKAGAFFTQIKSEKGGSIKVSGDGKADALFEDMGNVSVTYSNEISSEPLYLAEITGNTKGVSVSSVTSGMEIKVPCESEADIKMQSDNETAVFKQLLLKPDSSVFLMQSDKNVYAMRNGTVIAAAAAVVDDSLVTTPLDGITSDAVPVPTVTAVLKPETVSSDGPLPAVRMITQAGAKVCYVVGDSVSINIPGISANDIYVKKTRAGVYDAKTGKVSLVRKGTVRLYVVVAGRKNQIASIKVANPRMKPKMMVKIGDGKHIRFSRVSASDIFMIAEDKSVVDIVDNIVYGRRAGGTVLRTFVNGHELAPCYVNVRP